MKPFQTFFGDGEYSFCLTAPLVTELETKCGVGVGALCDRVFKRTFAHSDLIETIRLSLIGGGTAPKRAAELVATYVVGRPLSESYFLAAKILERVWFGQPHEKANG